MGCRNCSPDETRTTVWKPTFTNPWELPCQFLRMSFKGIVVRKSPDPAQHANKKNTHSIEATPRPNRILVESRLKGMRCDFKKCVFRRFVFTGSATLTSTFERLVAKALKRTKNRNSLRSQSQLWGTQITTHSFCVQRQEEIQAILAAM